MVTLGLCIIAKEWTQELEDMIFVIRPRFDEVYVQINGPKPGGKLSPANVTVSTFKWNNNFADARNALLKEVKTDYWLWLDTDDTLEGLENLRDIVAEMEAKEVDRMFALYEYAKNDLGEEIAPHWRERIIRTAHPYQWKGAVHETLLTEYQEKTAKTEAITVVHHKTQEDYAASIERNHVILEREYNKKPRDPRITMYLGMSLFTKQQWKPAIEKLVEHIRTSGSPEDQYRSWLKVAESHQHLGDLYKAQGAVMEAMKLLPHYPDAYFAMGMFSYEMEDYAKCVEWLKTGMDKPDPKTLSIVDPTLRYRCTFMGALAEFQRGRVDDAWSLINTVLEVSPNYAMALKYKPLFEEAYMEKQAIERAKWLISYTATKEGKPAKILEALPSRLALDIRLNPERNKLYPPKTWPEKSIVFLCAGGAENWGPETLDKGMGGSEEAIIYLSRELAKQGWQVTVYNDREDAYNDPWNETWIDEFGEPDAMGGYVSWLPYHTFNPKDTFDVFVAWRSPEVAEDITARKILCDVHDVLDAERVEKAAKYIDTFMVKSQYHRSLFPNVPDEKFVIVGNGIVKEQFNDEA